MTRTRSRIARAPRATIWMLALCAGTAQAQEAPVDPGPDEHLGAARQALEDGEYASARAELELALQSALEAVEADPSAAGLARVDGQLWDLSKLAFVAGALDVELKARTWCRDYREATLPPDHLHVQWARGNLATCLNRSGDLEGALALEQQVAEVFQSTYPPEHDNVLMSLENLALTLDGLGRYEEARDMLLRVLAVREAGAVGDERALMQLRMNLASTLRELGDYERARSLDEQALRWFEANYPPEHVSVRTARNNLALSLRQLGSWDAALALQREVLDTVLRVLPENHNEVQRARLNLGETLGALGDYTAARVLLEKVVAVREAELPDDHPDLALARAGLAIRLTQLGEFEAARALQAAVLRSYAARGWPEDHPRVLQARSDASWMLIFSGELDAAFEMLSESLKAAAARESNAIYLVPTLQLGLARVEQERGNVAAALELARRAVRGYERTLQADADELLHARGLLAGILLEAGETDELRAQLDALAGVIHTWIERSHVFAPREASAVADRLRSRVWAFDRYARTALPEAQWKERVFELAENLRAAATRGLPARDLADGELARAWQDALHARRRAYDLVGGLAAAGAGASEARAEALADAVLMRDQAEARLLESTRVPWIDRASLASGLPEGAAAIGFLVHDEARRIGDVPGGVRQALLAHVVRRDGSLARIELGPLEELEDLVERWRIAIGVGEPVGAGEAPSKESERALGEALRARVLDPVLACLGDETRLHVCLDGPLHLVPLDALPLGKELVGDRYRLLNDVSFGRRATPVEGASGTLVALGGVDFGAGSEGAGREEAQRGRPSGFVFGKLVHSLREVERLGQLYRTSHPGEPRVFTGSQASKSRLFESAPDARFLHLATHGFFMEGWGEDARGAGAVRSFDTLVRELAPMSLCGVALAGANGGRDFTGAVPGVLSGEELSGIDLSHCELAVLSACDTSLGLRSAGRGLQSLQRALHIAGARSSLTSLWRVDDESMSLLMQEIYKRLWIGGEPAPEALWNAKCALRALRAPPRDWAGWVLTQDADAR